MAELRKFQDSLSAENLSEQVRSVFATLIPYCQINLYKFYCNFSVI